MTTTPKSQEGRMANKLYSSREVAAQIGCTQRTVTRTATSLNIGQKVGIALTFTKTDIERLKKAIKPGPGNPNFGQQTEQ